MEKREAIGSLRNILNEMNQAKHWMVRTENLINEFINKIEKEEEIKDPTLDEIIGVLDSIKIDLKNLRSKRQE